MTAPSMSNNTGGGSLGFGEIAIAVAASSALAVLSLAFSAVVFLFSMNVAGCDASSHPCNFTLDTVSLYITPVAGLVAIAVALVFSLLNARRGRPMWHAFVVSTLLIVVAFAVALTLDYYALGPLVS